MQCPWCDRWCLKDDNCMYIFACGLDYRGVFHPDSGCGNSFCFQCGLKYCGPYYTSGVSQNQKKYEKHANARDTHDSKCCIKSSSFCPLQFCAGGHSSHCPPRVFDFDAFQEHANCTSKKCFKNKEEE